MLCYNFNISDEKNVYWPDLCKWAESDGRTDGGAVIQGLGAAPVAGPDSGMLRP